MGKQWYGVMGDPVAHSVSPAMMNAAFGALGLDAVYLAFCVSASRVEEAVRGLGALGAAGVNVTIPHKQAVLALAASQSAEAQLAGAANTLVFTGEGAIEAHNTDVGGWWQSVSPSLPDCALTVALVGAGGAARAVLTALALYRPDSRVCVIARDAAKARRLQADFQNRLLVTVCLWHERQAAIAASHLAVNATSLGMWPNTAGCAVTDASCFHRGQVVQDLVYTPLETRWLRLAREAGATTVDGLGMLVQQGAAAFQLWLGQSAPATLMREAAVAALCERDG